MARSKYINTFNTTADYENYIESAVPEFPNVGYDKEADEVIIRRQSPNDYQIWGTTTATSNFNIKLNNTNVEVTVDPLTGEFYLTGWTGTLTNLSNCFRWTNITSIKKFALDTSQVTNISSFINDCSNLEYANLANMNVTNVTNMMAFVQTPYNITTLDLSGWDISSGVDTRYFENQYLDDIYITEESTLMKLTNNLSSQGNDYISSSTTIHYNDVDYKWQNNAWRPQN